MYFKIVFLIFIGVAHGVPAVNEQQEQLKLSFQKVCDDRYNKKDLPEKQKQYKSLADNFTQIESDYKVFKASIKEYNEALQEKQEAGFSVNEIEDNIHRCYFFAMMCAEFTIENKPNKDSWCKDHNNLPLNMEK